MKKGCIYAHWLQHLGTNFSESEKNKKSDTKPKTPWVDSMLSDISNKKKMNNECKKSLMSSDNFPSPLKGNSIQMQLRSKFRANALETELDVPENFAGGFPVVELSQEFHCFFV
jgi:hypothetical protein